MSELKRYETTAQTCVEAGQHDFHNRPVVIRRWPLLEGRRDVAVVFCRRCGHPSWYGWTGEEAR